MEAIHVELIELEKCVGPRLFAVSIFHYALRRKNKQNPTGNANFGPKKLMQVNDRNSFVTAIFCFFKMWDENEHIFIHPF